MGDCLDALKEKVKELKRDGFTEEEILRAMAELKDEIWYRDW